MIIKFETKDRIEKLIKDAIKDEIVNNKHHVKRKMCDFLKNHAADITYRRICDCYAQNPEHLDDITLEEINAFLLDAMYVHGY